MDNKFDYIEPNNPMTFDEAWEYMDKMGFPVIRLSEEEYKQLMGDIGETGSMSEVDEILKRLE
jgi:hypothetical protein